MSSESKDVLNYLNEHFILTEISPDKLNTVFYNFERLNACHTQENQTKKIHFSKIQPFVYSIQRTEKTEIYFSVTESGFQLWDTYNQKTEEQLLFILDINTDYWNINSNRLGLEIIVGIGVSEKDIEEKSIKYLRYEKAKKELEANYLLSEER